MAEKMPLDPQQELDALLSFCTVKISQEKFGWGTGFFVTPGYILTCAHVVKGVGDKPVKVQWQKTGNPFIPNNNQALAEEKVEFIDYEATVEGSFADPFDLALLKLVSPPENHPCVYLDESAQPIGSVRAGDELYLFGYPDKDYENGAPVLTRCENLTRDNPQQIKFKEGQIRPGFSGSPLLNHRTRKVCGIVKYTRDKGSDLGGGAIPVSAVLSKFSDLKQKQKAFHRKHSRWQNLLPAVRCSLRRTISVALGVATLVFVARVLGLLQSGELSVFDHLIQMRPDNEPDSRILVIAIDNADYQDQLKQDEAGFKDNDISISNARLANLLNKLKEKKPVAIGLDLERNITSNNELKTIFSNTSNLFAICKIPSTDEEGKVKDSAVEAPAGIPEKQVGFANFIDEPVVRRHLLAQEPPKQNKKINCQTENSLSLVLAGHFLRREGIIYKTIFSDLDLGSKICSVQLEKDGKILTTFGTFLRFTGGYQRKDGTYGGCQLLLNYRRRTIEMRTLIEVEKEGGLENIENKIVLIGTDRKQGDRGDRHQSPYGDMPGVAIQAQMVSHILDAVLKTRTNPIIWVMPRFLELFLIYILSLSGGLIAWRIRAVKHVVIALAGGVFVLYLISLISFFYLALWIPLLPISIVFIASGVGVIFSSPSFTSSAYQKYLGSVS